LQGVDTRLKALQPGTTLGDLAYSSATANTNTRLPIGTTGQVLAVSGGVPAWTTTADVTPLTTKGDLFTFTTVDARLAVGSDYAILSALASESTGLKWSGKLTSYTPTWGTISGTAPSLGNGTLTGNYVRSGDFVFFSVKLIWGSTTTSGTNAFSFTLPFSMTTQQNGITGTASALDTGVAWYRGYAPNNIEGGYLDKFVMIKDDGVPITGTAPFTFATNDVIYVTGAYNV
jgi:hypothetical protein